MSYDRQALGRVRAYLLDGYNSNEAPPPDVEGIAMQYEHECLAAVRRGLLGLETLTRSGTEAKSFMLEGRAPSTTLLVLLERGGEQRTLDWRLWRDWFTGRISAGDPPETPEGVGQALLLEALEF